MRIGICRDGGRLARGPGGWFRDRRHDHGWEAQSLGALEHRKKHPLGGGRGAGSCVRIHEHPMQVGDQTRGLIGFRGSGFAQKLKIQGGLESR